MEMEPWEILAILESNNSKNFKQEVIGQHIDNQIFVSYSFGIRCD